jgi:hypothetical protein
MPQPWQRLGILGKTSKKSAMNYILQITDMSKRRNQANKQAQKGTKHVTQKKSSSLSGLFVCNHIAPLSGGLYPSGG